MASTMDCLYSASHQQGPHFIFGQAVFRGRTFYKFIHTRMFHGEYARGYRQKSNPKKEIFALIKVSGLVD